LYTLWHFLSRRMFSHLSMGMFITTLLFFEILGAGIAHASDGKAHFSVEPTFFPQHEITPRSYFTYYSHPATLIQDSIHLTNSGSARGTANLYAVDATTGQTGGTTLVPRNTPQHDVSTWIRLSRQQITLNPGQSLDIPFTLRIPGHVRPGQHIGIIIAQRIDQQVSPSISGSYKTRVQVRTLTGLGVLVNLPGKLVEKLGTTGITYNDMSTYQSVLVGLKNTGTQMLHPSGSLQITDTQGRLLQNMPLKLDTFLPQTAINYPVYIHRRALAPGRYEATLMLRYEHNHILNYKTSFYVPLPRLPRNTLVTTAISELVTPDTLTPWHYVAGIVVAFLLLSALFFWGRSAYKTTMKLRKKFHRKRTGK
jgi:hypothetical protein